MTSLARTLFVALWILAVGLSAFGAISFAGVAVRIPALISLCLAVILSILRRHRTSWLWIAGCVIGLAVALSGVYTVAMARGTSASSTNAVSEGALK